jgi:hypothetical protein
MPMTDIGARLVELLTRIHHGHDHRPMLAELGRDELEQLTVVMAGALYAAAEIQAEVLGVEVDVFLQRLALNAQQLGPLYDRKTR